MVQEIGAGVNDNRAQFLALHYHHCRSTQRPGDTLWVWLCGSPLAWSLEVVNLADTDREDLLHDLVWVIYSFAARLYGQRRAKRKTEAIVAQLKQEGTGETDCAAGDQQG